MSNSGARMALQSCLFWVTVPQQWGQCVLCWRGIQGKHISLCTASTKQYRYLATSGLSEQETKELLVPRMGTCLESCFITAESLIKRCCHPKPIDEIESGKEIRLPLFPSIFWPPSGAHSPFVKPHTSKPVDIVHIGLTLRLSGRVDKGCVGRNEDIPQNVPTQSYPSMRSDLISCYFCGLQWKLISQLIHKRIPQTSVAKTPPVSYLGSRVLTADFVGAGREYDIFTIQFPNFSLRLLFWIPALHLALSAQIFFHIILVQLSITITTVFCQN